MTILPAASVADDPLVYVSGALAQIGRAPATAQRVTKTHLHHIYEKLEVSEGAAAVAQALRRGLLR